MGKVIFEFDDVAENSDIENVINRNKLICALDEIKNFRTNLYKGFEENIIIVKNDKVINSKEFKTKEDINGTKGYISVSDVIDELDRCLSEVKHLLN